MKFINKVNNINLNVFYIILICFALEECMAHTFTDTSSNVESKPMFRHHAVNHHPGNQNPGNHHAVNHHPENQNPGNHQAVNHHPENHHAVNHHPGNQNPASHHMAEPPSQSSHANSPHESPNTLHTHESELGHGRSSFGHSSSFKAAFNDILKGAIRGPPKTVSQKTEAKQSSLGIEQICMHTEYPEVCLATINPLLTQNFDMINVLEAAITACSVQIKLTVTKVAKHSARNPEVANAVYECKDNYKNAMENLQKAMDALPQRDLGTVTVMLSSVMADVSSCESTFEDLKGPASAEQSKADGLVSITVSNCLAIASLIPY